MPEAPPEQPPRLSVCIPTHEGRAALLDRALTSVLTQIDGGGAGRVQVCVSDNGSCDTTQEVVARHRTRHPDAVVSQRFEESRGFTGNLLAVVEMADGDFCWLLGSDDELEPGALHRVLDILDANPGLSGITTNRLNVAYYDADHVVPDDPRVLPPPGRTSFSDAGTIFTELAMLQDYISTQVFDRERWSAAVAALGEDVLVRGGLFPHILILGAVIEAHPAWYWEAVPAVRHRVGNEALPGEWSDSMADYTAKVTRDRSAIWSQMLGPRSPVYRSVMRRMFLVQGNTDMLALCKLHPSHRLRDDLELLTVMVRHYWFVPELWRSSIFVLLLPYRAIPIVVAVFAQARRAGARLGALRPSRS